MNLLNEQQNLHIWYVSFKMMPIFWKTFLLLHYISAAKWGQLCCKLEGIGRLLDMYVCMYEILELCLQVFWDFI